MIDINKIRNNQNEIIEKLSKRNKDFPQIIEIVILDKKYRMELSNLEEFNAQRNIISKQISDLIRNNNKEEVAELQAKVVNIKKSMEQTSSNVDNLLNQINDLMLSLPNIPHSSVVVGKDEKDNKVVGTWLEPTKFDFSPLPHWELAAKNKLIDFERATKITGSRFVFYTNLGAKLMRALTQFTLDFNSEAGFEEMLPAVLVNEETLRGTGQLPKFEEDLFKLNNGYYLSPTAEVQLTNFYRNEILQEANLPYFFTANTSCFRSEAGSAGKDTKGVIRQHQFYKTEMVIISHPDNSYQNHELMVRQAEKILEALKLPYRRLLLCTGDMGFSSSKTYDLEVWLPSYNDYKEISSCSNCEDFQARRLKMRYKNANGEINFVHTLNGSGLAIDRLWAAVVENYQQEDGSIVIPEVLLKYFNNIKVIK